MEGRETNKLQFQKENKQISIKKKSMLSIACVPELWHTLFVTVQCFASLTAKETQRCLVTSKHNTLDHLEST